MKNAMGFNGILVIVIGLAVFGGFIFWLLRLLGNLQNIFIQSVENEFLNSMSNYTPATIYELNKTIRYTVAQDFIDYYNNQFRQGEMLTFLGFDFLPYDDGYTLNFAERKMYLQGDVNAEILQNMGKYLQPVPNAD